LYLAIHIFCLALEKDSFIAATTIRLGIVSGRNSIGRKSNSKSYPAIKLKPTTVTTTNQTFSPFFEVVFVVTHWGVSFAHSSFGKADTKLP
jgi:hypothetical protein